MAAAVHTSASKTFSPDKQGANSFKALSHGDRRSPLRPQFKQGWRKHIANGEFSMAPSAASEPASTIYVWTAKAGTLLAAASNRQLLNADDRAALEKLQSPTARASATAARMLLRLALSAIAGRRVAPRGWEFARDDRGKPFVVGNGSGIDFSVSHTDDVVMVAAAHSMNVGIDVETVDQMIEDGVIDQFCHATERQALDGLNIERRRRLFLEFWTQKEAYTKMLGVGHSLEFRTFSVMHSRPHGTAHLEDFYFSIDRSLYHAALFIDRNGERPIDIQLINAVLPCGDGLGISSSPC